MDSHFVTIGASIFALDGYNENEQEGGETDCINNICYIDLFKSPPGMDDSYSIYIPHDDWIDQINNTIFEPDFVKDIRYNDLYSLYSEGLNWDVIIEPLDLPSDTSMDSLLFSFEYSEVIDNCTINIAMDDGIEKQIIKGDSVYFSVNSAEKFTLSFNVSNICFKEF